MNTERCHHVDLHVAIEQDVESIEPPPQRRCNERALLRRRGLRNRWECGCGHWTVGILSVLFFVPSGAREPYALEKLRRATKSFLRMTTLYFFFDSRSSQR